MIHNSKHAPTRQFYDARTWQASIHQSRAPINTIYPNRAVNKDLRTPVNQCQQQDRVRQPLEGRYRSSSRRREESRIPSTSKDFNSGKQTPPLLTETTIVVSDKLTETKKPIFSINYNSAMSNKVSSGGDVSGINRDCQKKRVGEIRDSPKVITQQEQTRPNENSVSNGNQSNNYKYVQSPSAILSSKQHNSNNSTVAVLVNSCSTNSESKSSILQTTQNNCKGDYSSTSFSSADTKISNTLPVSGSITSPSFTNGSTPSPKNVTPASRLRLASLFKTTSPLGSTSPAAVRQAAATTSPSFVVNQPNCSPSGKQIATNTNYTVIESETNHKPTDTNMSKRLSRLDTAQHENLPLVRSNGHNSDNSKATIRSSEQHLNIINTVQNGILTHPVISKFNIDSGTKSDAASRAHAVPDTLLANGTTSMKSNTVMKTASTFVNSVNLTQAKTLMLLAKKTLDKHHRSSSPSKLNVSTYLLYHHPLILAYSKLYSKTIKYVNIYFKSNG